MLLGGCGLRVGELSCLMVSDIDYSKSFLKISPDTSKNNKYRSVYVPDPVLYTLYRYVKHDGYLFPGYRGHHLTVRQIENIVDRIATKANLQHDCYKKKNGKTHRRIHPHLLRHCFAVYSLDSHVPLNDIKDQLGHSSIVTTSIYLAVSPEHRKHSYLSSGFADILR